MYNCVNKNIHCLENSAFKETICPQPRRSNRIYKQRKFSCEDAKAASEEIQRILNAKDYFPSNTYSLDLYSYLKKSSDGENLYETIKKDRERNNETPNYLIFSMDSTSGIIDDKDFVRDLSFTPPLRSFNPIFKNSTFNENFYKREGAEVGLLSFSPP